MKHFKLIDSTRFNRRKINCLSKLTFPPPLNYPTAPRPEEQTGASNVVRIIAIVVIVVIVIAGGLAYRSLTVTHSSVNTWHSINIVDGLITVQAGHPNIYDIVPPKGASSIGVSGYFTSDATKGDILVMLMNQSSFVTWQNHQNATALYNSRPTSFDRFTAFLPTAGTYYLAYSNATSTFSSKLVRTTVTLYYLAPG
jgi:hypothetical protein